MRAQAVSTVPSVSRRFPACQHCMLDAYGCRANLLDDAQYVQEVIRQAAAAHRGSLIDLIIKSFEPEGLTAVAVLAESHLALHTWPEFRYAALDAFTCGTADPAGMCRAVAERLEAVSTHLSLTPRGGGRSEQPPEGK